MSPSGSLATPQIKFDQYGIAPSFSFHASHLAARGLFIHFRSFFGGIETRAEIQLLMRSRVILACHLPFFARLTPGCPLVLVFIFSR